jgi:hypothetical protein
VGHTIQAGVNGACGQQVLRVDVGMSQGCGNSAVEVLEILGDKQVGGVGGGWEGGWGREGGLLDMLRPAGVASAEALQAAGL